MLCRIDLNLRKTAYTDQGSAETMLTTIRVPYDRFARELYRALVQEIAHPYEDPAAVLVETELVVRNTTTKLQ